MRILKLRPGMTANASVVIGEKKNVLKIPTRRCGFARLRRRW